MKICPFLVSISLAGGILLLSAASAVTAADAGAESQPKGIALGLTVGSDGVLCKDGKPFRGIGVNYFNAFLRHLADPQDTSYRQGFEALAKEKIPFVRMAGCGFWPVEQRLHRDNPDEFFRRFDDVVKAAEECGIGIIPSLFWQPAAVPDLVGEPLDQWANPDSKTRAYMRDYVRDVVARYRRSPAIWGWEFGNEYNLAASLPNAAEHRPQIVPQLGTPDKRTQRDELTYEIIRDAFSAFAQEVRKYDDYRIITTGNSSPRECAWHHWKEKNWNADSLEQFEEMLRGDNPDPMNVVGIHAYGFSAKYLRDAVAAASHIGKPLFLGEFGPESGKEDREGFRTMVIAIEETRIPLSALWVYDYLPQDDSYNVTWKNARSWQLQAIAEANARIRNALETSTQ
jgi:hypothetical protein